MTLDYSQRGTHTSVSVHAAGASAAVMAFDANEDHPARVLVNLSAHLRTEHGELASWTAAIVAPDAADLLALLAPVVERLRAMAADELVARGAVA